MIIINILKQIRGQVVVISLSIALFLFLLVLAFFFESLVTSHVFGDNKMKILESEATRLSDSLLLSGYPINWNKTNVQKIGLSSNDILNLTKINEFKEMDYGFAKIYLDVQNDYFINISYINGTRTSILINNTDFESITGSDGKNFVVTRQRSSLIQDEDSMFPVSIFIMVYSD